MGKYKIAGSVAVGASVGCTEDRCPKCGAASGYHTYCQGCKTEGCTKCLGAPKPSGCNGCGRGPVLALTR